MPSRKRTYKEIELLDTAAQAEAAGDTEKAIELYEKSIKNDTLTTTPYDRLLVLYRKLKQYADELRVLKKGIAIFTQRQNNQLKQAFSHAKRKRHVQNLGMKLAKSLGAIDRKGQSTYQPEPLGKWLKRKAVVEKRLKNV